MDNSTGRKLSNQNKLNQTETKKNRNISLDKDYIKNNKKFKLKNIFNNNYGININNELNGNEKDIKNINKIIIKENNSLEEKIQKIFKKEKGEIKTKFYNEKDNNQNSSTKKEKIKGERKKIKK